MSDREQINTLISAGSGLPTANPYLDDASITDDEDGTETKKKRGRTPEIVKKAIAKNASPAPDPKEYIAELERPEEENLF